MLARRALLLRLWKELHLLVSSSSLSSSSSSSSATQQSQLAKANDHREGAPSTNTNRSGSSSTTPQAAAPAAAADANALPLLYGGTPPPAARGVDCDDDGDDENLLLLEPTSQAVEGLGGGGGGESTAAGWRLKHALRLHLYISDAPCGDASIYEQRRSPPPPSDGDDGGNSSGSSSRRSAGGRDGGSSSVPPASGGSAGKDGKGGGGERERSDDDRGDAKRHRCTVAAAGVGIDGGRTPCLPPSDTGLGRGGSRNSAGVENPPPPRQEERGEGRKETGGESSPPGGRESAGEAAATMTFTGAKIISAVKPRGAPDRSFRAGEGIGVGRTTAEAATAAAGDVVLRIDREQEQQLGALRIKSSRSNISEEGRTMSMSCSDKLAKWAVLGLQVHFMRQLQQQARAAAPTATTPFSVGTKNGIFFCRR